MCTTNDPVLAERLRVLRAHGGKPKYHHALIGGNFRLDEIQAAVLVVKLKYLDDWTRARQRNADHYNAGLGRPELRKWVTTPVRKTGYRHIYNQYVIRVQRRDELRRHLTDQGIGTEIYYPIALHMQKCFADLGYAPTTARIRLARPPRRWRSRSIRSSASEQIDRVIDTIAEFYRQ